MKRLTPNEVRILNYIIQARLAESRHWVHTSVIGSDLKIPNSTVPGSLRRLEARGVVFQDVLSGAWGLNINRSVTHQELCPP